MKAAGEKPSEKYSKPESEKWQAKAVETSCTFLPSECPLVGHVISSYQKHHSIISQAIPEDQELDEQLIFVRPLNDVKQDSINYHQIIKNHIPVARTLPQRAKKASKKALPVHKPVQPPTNYNDIHEMAKIVGENLTKYSRQNEKTKAMKPIKTQQVCSFTIYICHRR